MIPKARFILAAAGAVALFAAGPASAAEGRAGLKDDGTPSETDIQRSNFKDRKTVKTLRAVWDRLGEDGYHGFHDIRRGDGWISCLAWKDGELYKIRVDSETGSVISTRRVQ